MQHGVIYYVRSLLFIPFTAESGAVLPQMTEGNREHLSLKLQLLNSKSRLAPRVSDKRLWFYPSCTTDLWELNVTVPKGFSALPGILLLRKLRSRGELLLQDRQSAEARP